MSGYIMSVALLNVWSDDQVFFPQLIDHAETLDSQAKPPWPHKSTDRPCTIDVFFLLSFADNTLILFFVGLSKACCHKEVQLL